MALPFRKKRSYTVRDAADAFMKELEWLSDHMEKHDVKEHDERRVGEMRQVLAAWDEVRNSPYDEPDSWQAMWRSVADNGLDWWC